MPKVDPQHLRVLFAQLGGNRHLLGRLDAVLLRPAAWIQGCTKQVGHAQIVAQPQPGSTGVFRSRHTLSWGHVKIKAMMMLQNKQVVFNTNQLCLIYITTNKRSHTLVQ